MQGEGRKKIRGKIIVLRRRYRRGGGRRRRLREEGEGGIGIKG